MEENLDQLTENLELVDLKPADLPEGVKPDGNEWNPRKFPSGGVGQEVLTYDGVVYKVGQVVYTNRNINLGSKKGGLIPQGSRGVVIGPALQDEEFWISPLDQKVMVHLAFSKSISNNIHCSTISLWGNASPNNETSTMSGEESVTHTPPSERRRRIEEDKFFHTHDGSNPAGERREEREEEERRQKEEILDREDDDFYGDWGGRIKRFNQIRTKKSKKKINRKYKKTYKKTGGARKNRKNKTQRKKQKK